jgi:ATP-dependent Clp protease ATP-binding subunit ClpB
MDLLIDDINHRLSDREIKISLTDKAKNYIADNGYEPAYGARPLKRYLQKHVETLVAKYLLQGEANMGDELVVDVGNDGLFIQLNK